MTDPPEESPYGSFPEPQRGAGDPPPPNAEGSWGQAPPPRQGNYETKWIWLGVLLAFVSPFATVLIGGPLSSVYEPLAVLVAFVGLLGPLVGGILLAAIPGSPRRRGLGLGLVIGWGVLLLLVGGACVVFLATR